jgi:hypothetical protein
MSNTLESTNGLLPWLKSNLGVTITILGISIYAMFSIPATAFYAHLGTTPTEAGLNYTNILSGSTLGVIVVVTGTFAIIVSGLAYVGSVFKAFKLLRFLPGSRSDLLVDHSYKELDNKQFARKLRDLKPMYKHTEPPWEEIVRSLNRYREFCQRSNLTSAEAAEKEALEVQLRNIHLDVYARSSPIEIWRRSSKRELAVMLTIIAALAIGALTWIAVQQANDVREGNSFIGSTIGLFDYRAQPVYIKPASKDGSDHIPSTVPCGRKVFLLGENAQNIVIYVPNNSSPDKGSTVRLPVSEVIISGQPCQAKQTTNPSGVQAPH